MAPVAGLVAETVDQGSGGGFPATDVSDVRLSWQNGSEYELLRIERNGETVGEIPGGGTEFVDTGVMRGIFTYKVTALRGGKTSFPRSTLHSTLAPPGAFLRGDSDRDGRIDISDPIRTLTFLFLAGGPPACEDGADANDDGKLELTDAVLTLNHLFNGTAGLRAPGTRYPWYDPTPDQLSCGS